MLLCLDLVLLFSLDEKVALPVRVPPGDRTPLIIDDNRQRVTIVKQRAQLNVEKAS